MLVLLYPLITTMLYYLGARAMITSWLWSRYPTWLDHFMMCSACSGAWYGAGVAAIGYGLGVDVGGLPWPAGIGTVALASGVWTPLIAALQHKALLYLGASATPAADDDASVHLPPPVGSFGPQIKICDNEHAAGWCLDKNCWNRDPLNSKLWDGHGNYWDGEKWAPIPGWRKPLDVSARCHSGHGDSPCASVACWARVNTMTSSEADRAVMQNHKGEWWVPMGPREPDDDCDREHQIYFCRDSKCYLLDRYEPPNMTLKPKW